jgi:hypothetical protein
LSYLAGYKVEATKDRMIDKKVERLKKKAQ